LTDSFHFELNYRRSVWLIIGRWLVALLAASAITAVLYSLTTSLLLCLSCGVFVLGLFLTLLRFDRSFYHPKAVSWKPENGSEHILVDAEPYTVRSIWALGWVMFLVLQDGPKRIRMMLGKDVYDDQTWHAIEVWKVWRQRA
jgi:hypothetical protein